MTAADFSAITTGLGNLLTPVALLITAIASLLSLRQSRKNGTIAGATHELVNSKMTELTASIRAEGTANTAAAHAEGIAQGEQAQRDRAAEAQP